VAGGHLTTLLYIGFIGIVKIGLRTLGFAQTMRTIRRLDHHNTYSVSAAEAEQVALQVARAGSLYPGRARCLEQSMVLYFILRRRGAAVELRIGVRPYGFLAHAWVELDGRPIYEKGEVTDAVVAFPGLGV